MNGKLFAAIPLVLISVAGAQDVLGMWDATININGVETPFKFELELSWPDGAEHVLLGAVQGVAGSFFNGDERFSSTKGSLSYDGTLALEWDYYAAKLEATIKDGVLEGQYTGTRRMKGPFPIHAKRAVSAAMISADAPSIDGLWEIPTKSGKGENAWRFIVQQTPTKVTAAILRVDGDTGAIVGTYHDGKFVLSHFDGARAHLLQITPAKDGTLDILQDANTKLTAYRPAAARAKGLPEPTDPTAHTSVKDPKEPFRFSYPDLNGKLVSNTDARFQGKVVLVEVTGSWCPNCHDEAPFLAELYRKYRGRGLEIVSLSFEEADQLKDPTRLRAFVKKYGMEFPVLLGGDPDEAAAKLTQAVNWNSWPTTFFLDKKGLVRRVHAGFPSQGSGDLYGQAKEEFNVEVGRLLVE